ncbi:hypothetical protein CB0940_10537 [Cercospora beticola]|uniref:Uncharacterized protein n=1 Tax=Cercospora beticola TaxID=122368 RepID=A0A2G5HU14_CERBT|nr:hypothetical protein CB0940_10537 [Cercospora beticola]
MSIHCTGSALS